MRRMYVLFIALSWMENISVPRHLGMPSCSFPSIHIDIAHIFDICSIEMDGLE